MAVICHYFTKYYTCVGSKLKELSDKLVEEYRREGGMYMM